jgi:large subunit ribosomal protein L3
VIEGLLGKKVGMAQLFDEEGNAVPVTVIEAGPCTVVQVSDDESRKSKVVQVGFQDVAESKVKKPLAGHFKKAGVTPKKYLREVKVDREDEIKPGQEIRVDIFEKGHRVDVTGISKGKGFAGMMKRWNARGGPKTHGSDFHRRPGSVGASADPSRVVKGKRLPGQYGNKRVTALNVEILQVRPDDNLLLLKGSVPGPPKGVVFVRRSVKKKVKKEK